VSRVRRFALAGLARVGIAVGSAEAGWPPLRRRPAVAPGPVVASTAVAVPVAVVPPGPAVVAEPVTLAAAPTVVVTAPAAVRPSRRPGVGTAPRVIIR
jgi:hypothetical protein